MADSIANECRVVIYDDETDRARDIWKRDLLAMGVDILTVHVPETEEIQRELNKLNERRAAADKGNASYDIECDLDKVDVLVVDYDLRQLEDHRGFATGEEIAYAARLFSKVKIIVVVNHPDIGLNDFDLTLQRDHNLKADVYIGHEQIANPGLWRRDPEHDGFLPWSWPILLEDVAQFDQCLEQVSGNWDENILSYFGLGQDEAMLSSEMLAFLGMPKAGMTFEQLFSDPPENRIRPFVRPKDLKALLSDKERLSRVMTAILKKWLRRWILPAQTVLVDAPHLAVSLPWSLNGYNNSSQWAALPDRGMGGNGEMEKLLRPEVMSHCFGFSEWIGRPAFFIQAARKSLEVEDEPTRSFEFSKVPDLLFAEDLSRFILAEEAMEYDLMLGGQQQVRAVCDPGSVDIKDRQFDPASVIRVPQSMLA